MIACGIVILPVSLGRMEQDPWDVIVVGGGVAGLSAALMLGRARRRVLVVDAGSPRNRFAPHVHGVLGHEGTGPADLLARGRAEVAGYGVEVVEGTVERVGTAGDGLEVQVAGAAAASARALLVASGMADELPDVPGLRQRWGTGVLHCPYCHGWEVRDRRLGVLTTSPLGLHQAELVRQWSDRVVVFTAGLGPLDAAAELRLRARGVDLVAAPVVEVVGDGDRVTAVRTADGREVEVDALFTAGAPRPHDEFLAPLGLARTDTPTGSFLAVDGTGRTSHRRVWAVGNVVDPAAGVPMAMGAGAAAGAAVNAALVAEDVDAALRGRTAWPEVAPADYWEHRYAGSAQVWSGRANPVLVGVASGLEPGRALDLGCGEGGDAIWLAQYGWTVTGVDISPTAARRAADAARAAGVPDDRVRFVAADLSTLGGDEAYDLVTASYLHSPVTLDRDEILRRAVARVAPGGHLLVVSHAAPPPWAEIPDGFEPRFPTPAEEIGALRLDPGRWQVLVAEIRRRDATGPHGERGSLEDAVVLIRRA